MQYMGANAHTTGRCCVPSPTLRTDNTKDQNTTDVLYFTVRDKATRAMTRSWMSLIAIGRLLVQHVAGVNDAVVGCPTRPLPKLRLQPSVAMATS